MDSQKRDSHDCPQRSIKLRGVQRSETPAKGKTGWLGRLG
jgi:hypothetical protein